MKINSKISHFIILALSVFTMTFAFTVFAKEYGVSDKAIVNTQGIGEFSDTQIYDFTVSGGESIGTFPIKAYVTIEGLYKGSGSVFVYYDGDEDSGEVFDLPNSGDTGDLHMVLGDKKKKLESNSAGTFSHQLYIRPQGVTVSSISIHVTNTYSRDVGVKCEDGDSNTVKSKSIQFWVANEPRLSGDNFYTMNYGLNDDLSDITNPITSAYVEVVGMYDTSGSVDIYFNDKAIDGVTHELSSPYTYKQVSLLSKDISSLIQNQSGSDFTQNLHISANGLELINASVKFVITYKYKPMKSSCAGFPPKGEFSSNVLDTRTNNGVVYNSITWRGELGGDLKDTGKVKFQLATAPCSNGASDYPVCSIGSWEFIGGKTCSSSDWFESLGSNIPIDLFKTGCSDKFNGKQFYKYKVQICSTDCLEAGKTTPFIDDIFVSWSP